MLIGFTLFGAAWAFYALLLIEFLLIFLIVEKESPFWGLGSLFFVGALLHSFGDPSPIALAAEHLNISNIALYGVSYVAIGAVWCVAKWWFFVRRIRDQYMEIRRTFLSKHNVVENSIPNNLLEEWKEYLTSSRVSGARYGQKFSLDSNNKLRKPQISDYKRKAMMWMVYWPWSAIWTLIDDPIRRIFNRVYDLMSGLLQKISNHAFRGVDDDFRDASPGDSGDANPSAGTPDAGGGQR